LRIACRVNGETVQDGSTADMIFGVAELVAFASATITLEPGDVIATGTPPGVAMGRPDGRYLQPGDVVEVEIERVGTLANPVRNGALLSARDVRA
jgi:2-keto-4-pentenoate hydratase/2-oxohepta-3-ene-1,7-dioic acid hydratase in catechol pathway